MKSALLRKVIAMSKFFCYLVIFQALFASLAIANNGFGQRLEETHISSNWNQLSLEKAFADIQSQTDLFFTYTYETIENIKISNNNKDLAVVNILKFISADTGLRFKIVNDIIYVFDGDFKFQENVEIKVPAINKINNIVESLPYSVIYEVPNPINPTDKILKGNVTSSEGEALTGATVVVKETGQGTVTDVDGSFSVVVPDEGDYTLVVSYVGYQTEEVDINGRSQINIELLLSISKLDEVVVLGYGTGTKEKFNGAVSKVDNDRLNNYATANFEQGLIGNIAGIQIFSNGKNPGDNSVIQIRGLNTLTAGTNPLIVVDGNPLSEGSSFSSINPLDIESVSILKDAASAAIYGSRASNGVILITTKKGKAGKLQVTYDGYTGFQERIDNFELADAYGTALFDNDARNYGYISGGQGRSITDDNATRDTNGGGKRSRIQPFLQGYLNGTPGLTNTNWADEVFRIAPQQNHYLNLSGGSEKTDYTISFGYFSQDNIVIESDYQRYTNNFKLNLNINDYVRFGISSNLSFSDAKPTGEAGWSNYGLGSGRQPDPAFSIILMHPYYPVYETDGSLAIAHQIDDNNDNWDGPISENTVAHVKLSDYTEQFFRAFGNTYLEVEPLAGLKLRTSFGGDYNAGVEEFFAPSTFGNYRTPVENNITQASRDEFKRENIITENLLTYTKEFGQHNIDILFGYSYQQETINRTRLTSNDFTDDNLRNVSGGTNIIATSASSKWALESGFSRLQYAFANKYSVSASLRRDGSSRFGANTKYGNFASFSAGWTISNESFFPQDGLVSFAKARASWGQTGNNQIGNYASIALIDQDNYVIDGGLEAGSYTRTSPNADLSWETNTALNFGIDLGFLDNKLFLTAEYYTSNTTDLLLNVPVPQQSGFSQSLQNIGELENSGFELEFRGNGFKIGKVGLGFNANITTNRNEVIALGTGQTQIIQNNGGMNFITRVGESVAQFYAFDIIGVYRSQAEIDGDNVTPLPGTEVGDYIVRDVNGDGAITPDDRAFLGDYNPDITYGFGFNVNYSGFDMALQFNGVSGRKAADRMVYYADSGEGFFVPSQYYLDNYFNERNPDGFFRRPDFSSFSSAGRLTRASSLSVLDADYFRLRSIQIGYTIPRAITQKAGIEGIRLYITGNNIFNISDFRGYNPDGIDTRSNTSQTLTRGWIQSASPLTRFIAFGINARF